MRTTDLGCLVTKRRRERSLPNTCTFEHLSFPSFVANWRSYRKRLCLRVVENGHISSELSDAGTECGTSEWRMMGLLYCSLCTFPHRNRSSNGLSIGEKVSFLAHTTPARYGKWKLWGRCDRGRYLKCAHPGGKRKGPI